MRGIVAAVLWSIVCGSVVASAAERAGVSPSEERDLGSGHSFLSGTEAAAAFRVGDKAPAFSAIDLQGRWIPFRSLVGRRTHYQIAALDWSEEPRQWLPAFAWGPFTPPAEPIER